MVGSAEGQKTLRSWEPCRALELIGEIVPSRRLETSIPVDSNLPVSLLRQIFVEERRQLAEVLLRLGRIRIARILRM